MLLLGVTPHISYDYYSPKPGATNHTSLATFSIPLSLRSTTQQISVCQPSPVPCPCPPCQLWEVSHHTSPQTLHSYYYLPRPGVTNHTSPVTFSTLLSQHIFTIINQCWRQCAMCQYNLLYLRPGATLHVLLTSCMKCPITPVPHINNTSQLIFGQKPVSLSMSSLPAVWSVPAHLHLMVTTPRRHPGVNQFNFLYYYFFCSTLQH